MVAGAEALRPEQDASTKPTLLVLTNERATNRFGPYLPEILKAEGFGAIPAMDVANPGLANLAPYSTVLLAEGPLTVPQTTTLAEYVSNGGCLVSMRPGPELASVLGVAFEPRSSDYGYIRIDEQQAPLLGVESFDLQFHGPCDAYRLAGAEPVAWLCQSRGHKSPHPAITVNRYGRGLAATWAFDLALNIAYTRQGNPEYANQERDGLDDLAAVDMFVGWVDLELMPIPQADLHQRLLVSLMASCQQRRGLGPLPRLWYLPADGDCLLIVTSDAHRCPGALVEDFFARVERRGGHATVYYMATPIPMAAPLVAGRDAKRRLVNLPVIGGLIPNRSAPTPSQVAEWRARGHEFGIHPVVDEGVAAGYEQYTRYYEDSGYGPKSPTVRTHSVLWSGWVETARVQASAGLRMNFDYYHFSPMFRDEHDKWWYGYFTGSGQPMRCVDARGELIGVYQQLTELVDEHILGLWWSGPSLSGEQAVGIARELIDRSLAGAYGPVVSQFHADLLERDGEHYADFVKFLEGTLDYAAKLGVQIWSAEEWLAFVEARWAASFTDHHWDDNAGRLTVSVRSPGARRGSAAVMLPAVYGSHTLARVDVGAATVQFRQKAVAGISYALVPLPAGQHRLSAYYE